VDVPDAEAEHLIRHLKTVTAEFDLGDPPADMKHKHKFLNLQLSPRTIVGLTTENSMMMHVPCVAPSINV